MPSRRHTGPGAAVGRDRQPIALRIRLDVHFRPSGLVVGVFIVAPTVVPAQLHDLAARKMEHLPIPGAIAPGTPTVDLTKTGDSLFTNAMVDNHLVTQDGHIRATALLYANGRDLKDPVLSPIYGDVHGFPPAILTSGTRDLYLSNTVRMHRTLRAAGVEAVPAAIITQAVSVIE